MSEQVIDPEAWQNLISMIDPAFLIELIDTYLSDAPGLIEQMEAGLAAGDAESVRRSAHSLKSNSFSFGATRLGEASRELEMLARGGSLAGAGERLAAVKAAFAELKPVLEKMKSEP
jgi:HPt (histidine-containing phosphotransfer) domain-containing protein